MKSIKRIAIGATARTMAWLKSNAYFKALYASLLYDSFNRDQFTNVAEQEKMLADEVRFDAYARAISKYVSKGDVVLDVGTGSGVLSFLAARQEPARIFAVDHSGAIELAEYIARRSGIPNIEFLNVHSRKFAPREKVDIMIHEQIGSGLLNENMVETIVDLRDRVLKAGGRIIPAKFDLYLEPVQLKDECRVPLIFEHKYQNADYGCLRTLWRDKGQAAKVFRSIQNSDVDRLLSEPERVFACDLQTMTRDEVPGELQGNKVVRRDGRLDGFCLYFRVIFDEEISFSTFPDCRRTHWSTPIFRVEPRLLTAGERLGFRLKLDNVRDLTTWRVEVP